MTQSSIQVIQRLAAAKRRRDEMERFEDLEWSIPDDELQLPWLWASTSDLGVWLAALENVIPAWVKCDPESVAEYIQHLQGEIEHRRGPKP